MDRSTVLHDGPIERYAAGLAAALRGPRRVRDEMVAEARDGLQDAAEALEEAGLDRVAAERRAVADFGTYRQVVPSYQAELASHQGKRTALWIALALPVMMLLEPLMWWDSPWSIDERASALYWVLVEHFQHTSFGAAAVAALVVAGFSWGSRYLRDGVRYTRIVGFGTMAFLGLHGLVGAAVFVLSIMQWPAAATWPPVIVGMLVNAAAFGYAGLLAVRCVTVTRSPVVAA
ncbi:permease prefix domain 1-containing protein [Dactylosporangium sp. NPDC005572]|uniref:permease prefix domain 1-containing protein n=1 Tax=Dactylosporangium sp. NPDC005572 TaxID=3156889 RepID=UPI0033A437A0